MFCLFIAVQLVKIFFNDVSPYYAFYFVYVIKKNLATQTQ